MGLFDSLLRGNKKQKQPQQLHNLTPWSVATPKHEVVISGNDERPIYVYDSSPLKNVMKGQVVTVELFRGSGGMTSTASGTYSDASEFNDCIVLYEGQPIGFISFPVDKLRRAAELGYAIKMNAKCSGMLEGYQGIKEMRSLMPKYFHLYDWIPGVEDDRPDFIKENFIGFSVYKPADVERFASRREWEYPSIRLEVIPTPPKSKAKPHIAIFSDDGMLLFEATGKDSCYKDLFEAANKYSSFSAKAIRKESSNNGSPYYRFEILGK